MSDRDVGAPLLEMRDISKSFPGVRALEKVRLSSASGRSHSADRREWRRQIDAREDPDRRLSARRRPILLDGKEIALPNAESAFRSGITATHQETVLFDELSVTENIFLGHQVDET